MLKQTPAKTWLELLHKMNMEGIVIQPWSFYKNQVKLEGTIPLAGNKYYTGTFAVKTTIYAPFGKTELGQCAYNGETKKIFLDLPLYIQGLKNTLIYIDHGFTKNGENLIQLFDKNSNLITTDTQMQYTDTVNIRLHEPYRFSTMSTLFNNKTDLFYLMLNKEPVLGMLTCTCHDDGNRIFKLINPPYIDYLQYPAIVEKNTASNIYFHIEI